MQYSSLMYSYVYLCITNNSIYDFLKISYNKYIPLFYLIIILISVHKIIVVIYFNNTTHLRHGDISIQYDLLFSFID
jgi:hypothetical protein